jgi:predicted kinase
MKNQLIIVRGPSGSGKSTWVKNNYPTAKVCSADNFFMRNGEYKFNLQFLSQAHASCMGDVLASLKLGRPVIVVDNTNIRLWEIENYILAGELAGYDVSIFTTMPTSLTAEELALRNTHGVSVEIIRNHLKNYERHPIETPIGKLS